MFYEETKEMLLYQRRPEITEKIDEYIGNMPKDKIFTMSQMAIDLNISLNQSNLALCFYKKKEILKEEYWVVCPKCNHEIQKVQLDDLARLIVNPEKFLCEKCGEETDSCISHIYVSYRKIRKGKMNV